MVYGWLFCTLDTDVAVINSATVKGLELGVKTKINKMGHSKMAYRHVSRKHVWRNFCLSYSYHNEKVLDDGAILQDYGIQNHSQVEIQHAFPHPCPLYLLEEMRRVIVYSISHEV